MNISQIAASQGVNSAVIAEPVGNDGPEGCSTCKLSNFLRVDRSGSRNVTLGCVVSYRLRYLTVTGFSNDFFIGHDLFKNSHVGKIAGCLVIA